MDKQKNLVALMLGDVIGQPGNRALFLGLSQLVKKHRVDIVVVNGENALNDGLGLDETIARSLFSLGVHVITSGNHVWHNDAFMAFLDADKRVLRPANYPQGVPGSGMVVLEVSGMQVAVINLQGRQNMGPLDCPLQVGKGLVEKVRKQTKIILVDFHAEMCEEKEALGMYLDGRVSLVVGTHTHVQTMDNKILPKGTGYITDLGMCGPVESVIGSEPTVSIERQMTQLPLKNRIAASAACIQGVVCSIDPRMGNTVSLDIVNEQYHV